MFFGQMSIFGGGFSLQSPKNEAAAFWLPCDCVLCGRDAAGPACAQCAAALETVQAACERCALPLPAPGICGECLQRPPAYDGAMAVFTYRFPLDRLVQRYKYAGDLAIGRWLGARLAERARQEERPDVLVSPPLSASRLRARGFNQALELGKVCAARLSIPCDLRGVTRSGETPAQAGLARRERLANLRGAFRCRRSFTGLRVAIVDDVLTTGATAEALARVLKEAGAASVVVWALARTPR
jgi:ComF family protein